MSALNYLQQIKSNTKLENIKKILKIPLINSMT